MPTEVITKTDGEIVSDSLDKIAAAVSADFEPSLVVGVSEALHRCADSNERVAHSIADLATVIQVGLASLSDAIRSRS